MSHRGLAAEDVPRTLPASKVHCPPHFPFSLWEDLLCFLPQPPKGKLMLPTPSVRSPTSLSLASPFSFLPLGREICRGFSANPGLSFAKLGKCSWPSGLVSWAARGRTPTAGGPPVSPEGWGNPTRDLTASWCTVGFQQQIYPAPGESWCPEGLLWKFSSLLRHLCASPVSAPTTLSAVWYSRNIC